MSKIIISIKRFLGNKNTVTILGVLIGVLVLYIGYNWRVKQAVEPVEIPYAKVAIKANTQITSDMLGKIKVSKSMVDQTSNLVTSNARLVGKYVKYDTTIPEGALFYDDGIVEEKQMPNYIKKALKDECQTLYSLPVDLHSTYANAIMPDDLIDLYFSARSDNGKVILTKLIEKIKVIDVRDSKGVTVFSSMSTTSTPSELIFAVPNNMFSLLKRAENIGGYSIKIFPVPRNAAYNGEENEGENTEVPTIVTSQEVIDFIDSKTESTYTSNSEIDANCEYLYNNTNN